MQLAETFANAAITTLGLGAGDNERVCSRQRGDRFAEPAAREHCSAGEWIEGVEQDYVEVAHETAMLKTVVEETHASLQLSFYGTAGGVALRTDSDVRNG